MGQGSNLVIEPGIPICVTLALEAVGRSAKFSVSMQTLLKVADALNENALVLNA